MTKHPSAGSSNKPKPALTAAKQKTKLAIKDHAEEDNEVYDDMPDLQDVSNSSDNRSDDDDDDGDVVSEVEYVDEESDDDNGGYDTEDEEDIRELLRQAMDLAYETDLLNAGETPSDSTKLHQLNPFLKLLGSLRGQ